jgi:hypothetical protein
MLKVGGAAKSRRRFVHAARWVGALSIAWAATACAPKLDVGSWSCGQAPLDAPDGGGRTVASTLPIAVPWATSFEDGFCGYTHAGGWCYVGVKGREAYALTDSVAHSGHEAAAFSITATGRGEHTRCVREGILPAAAYYGAWYYVPIATTNAGNWNLLHFQGGDDGHNLWDINLVNLDDGGFSVVVRDFPNASNTIAGMIRTPAPVAEVRVGAWFHLVFYLARAPDTTGSIALYVNDRSVMEVTGIITDDSDWGQWYVGNLADNLTPTDSTVYVDDVTIRDTP